MSEKLLLLSILIFTSKAEERPNIIVIVADDLGWNDVGFHGSNEVKTPNIDALAYDGQILNNYYVNPICSPSRSALMTGMYPIHTGLQHGVIGMGQDRGIPLNFTLLPEFLHNLGYQSHAVGKWHLGYSRAEYLPTKRGFGSHYGYWAGMQDYYSHTIYLPGVSVKLLVLDSILKMQFLSHFAFLHNDLSAQLIIFSGGVGLRLS